METRDLWRSAPERRRERKMAAAVVGSQVSEKENQVGEILDPLCLYVRILLLHHQYIHHLQNEMRCLAFQVIFLHFF